MQRTPLYIKTQLGEPQLGRFFSDETQTGHIQCCERRCGDAKVQHDVSTLCSQLSTQHCVSLTTLTTFVLWTLHWGECDPQVTCLQNAIHLLH